MTTNLPAGWVPARHTIELTLSRPLAADEGRLALLVGGVDVSDLLDASGQSVRYVPSGFPLPSGQSEIVAYVVSPANAWQEIARVPLRALTPGGYEQVEAKPLVDIGFKSQVAEGHSPPTNAPPRETFADLTLQGSVETRVVRNGVAWTNAATIVGSSFSQEALRFGERGDAAPQIDLANYLVQIKRGAVTTSVGHLTIGASRHLVNGFTSRGMSFEAPLGPQATFSLAFVNGSAIVGWNNPLGVTREGHRFVAGTLGAELIRARPGALRAEVSFLSGSLLPEAGYNEGAVTDAQDSRGVSFRVAGADATQRLRVDGGYTRSRFVNPVDPLLSFGTTLVPVRPETRDARYIDASAVVVDHEMAEGQRASLTVFARHEQVDPLFKSIGALAVQPDLLQNQIEAQATIGQATVQVQHTRLEDNLDDLESMLKTLTRRNMLSAMVPLGALAQPANPVIWAPRVTYMLDRTRQFGDALPVNSDFSDSHVPDQQSTNQTLAFEWEHAKWRAAYRWGRSFQDNRQIGRQASDLKNVTNVVAFGVVPHRDLDIGIETSVEQARSEEFKQTDTTRRFGLNADWHAAPVAIRGLLSSTWTSNSAQTASSRSTQIDIQATWQVRLVPRPRAKPAARAFLKYSHLLGRSENRAFGLFLDTREGWTMNTGVTVGLF